MATVEEFDQKKSGRQFDVAVSLLSSQLGDWRENTQRKKERENSFEPLLTFKCATVHKRSFQFKVSNNLHLTLDPIICVNMCGDGKEKSWSTKSENCSDYQSHQKVHRGPKYPGSEIVGRL